MSQQESSSDLSLRNAIRDLRTRLGMSQQQFAQHIGKSYGMVQRYEQKRAPVGAAILPFVDLAEKAGFGDLVTALRAGIVGQLVQNAPSALPTESSVLIRMLQEQSSDEATLVSLWILCMRALPRDSVRVLGSVMLAELMLHRVPEQMQAEMELVLEGVRAGLCFEEIVGRINERQARQR